MTSASQKSVAVCAVVRGVDDDSDEAEEGGEAEFHKGRWERVEWTCGGLGFADEVRDIHSVHLNINGYQTQCQISK